MSNYPSPAIPARYHPSDKKDRTNNRRYYGIYRRWRKLTICSVSVLILIALCSSYLFTFAPQPTTLQHPNDLPDSSYTSTIQSSMISSRSKLKSLFETARHAILKSPIINGNKPDIVPNDDKSLNLQKQTKPVTTQQASSPPLVVSPSDKNPATAVLVAIPTSHTASEYMYRQTIRQTWGGLLRKVQYPHSVGTINAELYFFIGTKGLNAKALGELHSESSNMHDLVLLDDCEESYTGLSAKMLILHRWINKVGTQKWPNLKYIFKTDTDVWFDVKEIMSLVSKYYTSPKTMIGYKYVNNVRLTEGKWANPEYSSPVYPQYMAGAGYLMSVDISSWISRNEEWLKPLPNEDAVLGIWLAGSPVKWIHSKKFKPLIDPRQPDKINRLAHWVCNDGDILFHHLSSKGIINLHTNYLMCGSPCEATCLRLAEDKKKKNGGKSPT